MDYLADAWQRVEWADREGEAFQAASEAMIRSGVHATRVTWKDAHWEAAYHVFDPVAETLHLTELARSLGSFLDHARAALNYTAFQIAQLALREDPSVGDASRPGGPLKPEAVEFPIFRSPTLYRRQNRIKKLPEKYKSAIEAIQPYHGGRQALWTVHELAGAYRHHVIQPIAIATLEEHHKVLVDGVAVPPTDVEMVPHSRLHKGDVLMRFTLPDLPDDAVVDPQVALTIGIDHPSCRGEVGITVMNSIITDVGDVMSILETSFFDRTRFDTTAQVAGRAAPPVLGVGLEESTHADPTHPLVLPRTPPHGAGSEGRDQPSPRPMCSHGRAPS
jgi:hypothetical protein